MKAGLAWLLCLLLLGLALRGSTNRARPHSMEARTPDINPAWYMGRGFRPVGRFGRRRAALEGDPRPGSWRRLACFTLVGGARSLRDKGRSSSSRK
ncbi:prolactin-releasing peptide [Trichechus manatus latirostris]|uniref:Prolactin-releasing peptide n=1 Tax=Trichechus manatus latirostris TaxID=127582 RepID=A0A2Y9RSH4_TRIMA|nr:prolactin-releasing peptide [Trichechus manatus latirostris]